MIDVSILHFIVITTTFFLGGLVFRTNPYRTTNQIYLVISIVSGFWIAFIGFASLCTTSTATNWIRSAHSVGATIPVLCDWLRLAILHPDKKISAIIRLNPFMLFFTLLFAGLAQTPLIIQGAFIPDISEHPGSIPEAILGPWYFLYSGFFVLQLGTLALRFLSSRNQATGMPRLELSFTCLGVLLSISMAILVSILIPFFTGSSQTTQLASLSVMILNLIIAYGIATRRIMNIAYLFRLLTAYVLVIVYLGLLYIAIWFPLSYLQHKTGIHPTFLPGVIASIVVAFSLAPANGLMQRFARKLFIHHTPLDMETVAQLTNQRLYSISTIEKLLGDFNQSLSKILGIDNAFILLKEGTLFTQKYPPSDPAMALCFTRNEALVTALARSDEIIVPAVLRRMRPDPNLTAACKTIENHRFAAAIGLYSSEGMEGICLLGPKLNGHVYSSVDQNTLQLLFNHLAAAINNARLYTQLQDSKIYNEILVDSLVSGVIAAGPDGTLTVFNREAQRITRRTPDDTLGHPLSVLPTPLDTLLRETLAGGTATANSDYLLPGVQAAPTPVRVSSSVIFGHAGKRLGAFLVINDLTTIKQLEHQIRRTDRLASLGTLAAGMAHEIKNPLVSIKTFTQLLPERYEDADFRDTFSSLVGGEVKRIDSIVNQLLRFSRPAKPVLAPASLHDLLNSTIKLLQQQMRTRNIRLVTSFTVTADRINADGDQLSQAFVNFFLNAIDSMPDNGTLTVSTALPPSDHQQNGWWCSRAKAHPMTLLSIRDTGEGISKENLAHIFDPFFTTKAQGTGLGLSVAHGIIQEHGGVIDVRSEPGAGTTFTIAIPLLEEETPP